MATPIEEPKNPVVPASDADPAAASGAGPAAEPTDDSATPEGTDALGDPGKKALDSMKSKWHSERDARRALEAQIAELTKPAEGATPDAEAVRTAAEKAATTKANKRILRAEIKAAATGKFADVSDALLNLDISQFEVNENGEVDATEISDAINEVLTRKPHLAAATAKRFQGTGDGGAQPQSKGPAQYSRADLKGKSAQWIKQAKDAGHLNDLLGIS